LADNIKAICFVWRNVRSTEEGEQKLENTCTTAMSMNGMKDRRGEGAAAAAYGWKEKLEVKER